jgi:hypothetical protein
MMKRLLILIFISWSTLLHANGDLFKIMNEIQANGIQEPSEKTNSNNQTANQSDEDRQSEPDWDFDFTSIDKSLSFVTAYEDMENFNLLMVKDITNFSTQIIKKNLVEVFDNHYSETKFYCDVMIAPELDDEGEIPEDFVKTPEHFKCDDIIAIYDSFNTEIDRQLNLDDLPGGKVADLFAITLQGEKVTENEVRDHDPNYDIMLQSEQTPNRNSVIEKHHVVKEEKKSEGEIDLTDAICNIQKRIELKVEDSVLKNSIKVLKDSLVDLGDEVELKDKQVAFCTLYDYWVAVDNYDEIMMFLYLHQPEGDLPCSP